MSTATPPSDLPERLNLIEFPCEFPLKIMGKRVDDFAQTIAEVVQQFAPDFDPATLEMRPSSSGKYLGLTCTINATSQADACSLIKPRIFGRTACNGIGNTHNASVRGVSLWLGLKL